MSSNNPTKYVAAGLAAVVVAAGGYAIGTSGSGNGSSGTATAAQSGQAPAGAVQGGPAHGFGTPATGAAAAKAKAAALAKYKGTVEQVMKLGDGSYEVHVITSSGEYHVTVSKDFKVTGADQGGPGGPRGAGAQGAPPQSGSRSGAPSGATS